MCNVTGIIAHNLYPPPPPPMNGPCLQHSTFLSLPTHSSLFLLSINLVLVCHVLRFRAHERAPPSPPVSESSLTCHVSIQLMDKPQTEVINWWRKCDYGCQDTVNSMIGLFLIDIKYTVFSFITAYLQRISAIYQKL